MGIIDYDRLVRGVVVFRETALSEAPFLGAVLDNQLEKLTQEIEGTVYEEKVKKGVNQLKLEKMIREFIQRYKPHLNNMAVQYNPYLDRGVLTPFVNRPLFYKLLQEEKGLYFDFDNKLKASVEKFDGLRRKEATTRPLSEERIRDLCRNYMHVVNGVATGGRRPKRLISAPKLFEQRLDENYYEYKNRPFAVIELKCYRLYAVLDFDQGRLYLHDAQSGRKNARWEDYKVPRKHAWALHEEPLVNALDRALRNNHATPWPEIPKEVVADTPTRVFAPTHQKIDAVSAIRKKLTPHDPIGVLQPS